MLNFRSGDGLVDAEVEAEGREGLGVAEVAVFAVGIHHNTNTNLGLNLAH